jgi:transcriptional regulator with XRE-family HTH domain
MKIHNRLNRRVGKNIRFLRKCSGLTQEALSSRLLTSRVNVIGIEKGTTQLTLANLQKLTQVFKCDYNKILQ